MDGYLIVLIILLVIAAIVTIILIAYSISAAYQQTMVITIPFEETYRYVPNLNREHKFKLDAVKITITGAIKKDSASGSTIVPGMRLKELIHEQIVRPYKDCLLVQEANTFLVEETILKRCPITKSPTLENLSIMFFNKLAPLLPELGCQIVSVKLVSQGMKVTHSRYKPNTYRV